MRCSLRWVFCCDVRGHEVIGEDAGERVRPFLMDRVAGAQHDLEPAVAYRTGKPPRGGDIAVVELAGDEGAGHVQPPELVPERLHDAGPHAAERAGEPGGVV